MGSIRARRWASRNSTAEQPGSLEEPPLARSVQPSSPETCAPRLAVLGSGPAALACVRSLAAAARAEGSLRGSRISWFTFRGKMASQMSGAGVKTICQAGQPYHDYGCQFFTAQDPDFEAEVLRWSKLGCCQAMPDGSVGVIDGRDGFTAYAGQPCWVGNGGMAPMMSALVTQTVDEFDDVIEHFPGFPNERNKVQSCSKIDECWSLTTQGGRCHGPFDVVVGTFSHITSSFLASAPCAAIRKCLRQMECNEIIAMQVIFDLPLNTDFALAHVRHHPDLCFVSNNSRKPQQCGSMGTPGPQHWTLLSTAHFAEREVRTNPKGYRRSAERRMLGALAQLLGLSSLEEYHPRVQRINHWDSALHTRTPPNSRGCLFDLKERIGWCGDFCVAPCVEGAFLSGTSMAQEIAAYWTKTHVLLESGDLLPDLGKPWVAFEPRANAAAVDIGEFPGLAGQLPTSCTHNALVIPEARGNHKDIAEMGAGGKQFSRGDGGSPYQGKGEGKIRHRLTGKGRPNGAR